MEKGGRPSSGRKSEGHTVRDKTDRQTDSRGPERQAQRHTDVRSQVQRKKGGRRPECPWRRVWGRQAPAAPGLGGHRPPPPHCRVLATTATILPLARGHAPPASCLARVLEGSCWAPSPGGERNFSPAWGGERRKGAPMGPWHPCPSATNQRKRPVEGPGADRRQWRHAAGGT